MVKNELTYLMTIILFLLSSCTIIKEGPDPPREPELMEIVFHGLTAKDYGTSGYYVEIPADSCTFEFGVPESYDEFSPYLWHGYTIEPTKEIATKNKGSITWDWGSVTQAEDADGRPIFNVRIAENTFGEKRTVAIMVAGTNYDFENVIFIAETEE